MVGWSFHQSFWQSLTHFFSNGRKWVKIKKLKTIKINQIKFSLSVKMSMSIKMSNWDASDIVAYRVASFACTGLQISWSSQNKSNEVSKNRILAEYVSRILQMGLSLHSNVLDIKSAFSCFCLLPISIVFRQFLLGLNHCRLYMLEQSMLERKHWNHVIFLKDKITNFTIVYNFAF
jgi:hypothetical protein